ncbi:hypothetical protein GALL_458260 [mine drainage metagenome]|uniref:Uncharacterized protein n=1 Tax=mine drainage metagenome TaxID=410659 RepID=A0A1J5Q517_9ZZZZ
MAEKKQKRPMEAITGLYGAIPHAVLDSVAFKGASHPAKALLFDLIRQHSGNNNGRLHLSFSWLESRGWKSRDVIQRARAELIARGLLIQTRQGGLNIGASRYGMTWLHISNFVGLDIQGKDYHPGAWGFMDKLPMGFKNANAIPPDGKGKPASRYSPLPPAGTDDGLTVPPAGTKKAHSGNSTVPPDGNNECITTTHAVIGSALRSVAIAGDCGTGRG